MTVRRSLQFLFHIKYSLLRVSLNFIQCLMKESVIILRAEITVVFLAFFITAMIFDPPRKRQDRYHYEMFKLTQQTIVT